MVAILTKVQMLTDRRFNFDIFVNTKNRNMKLKDVASLDCCCKTSNHFIFGKRKKGTFMRLTEGETFFFYLEAHYYQLMCIT